MSHAPSDKQIALANKISDVLELDFPRGDFEFSAAAYWNFINKNIKAYKEVLFDRSYVAPMWVDEDDIFYGLEEGLWEY